MMTEGGWWSSPAIIATRPSRRAGALPLSVLLFCVLLLPVMAEVEADTPALGCRADRVLIHSESGETIATFAVELAITPASRASGLMYRESLDPLTGMLFIYPEAEPVAFWMRNTLISLDLLFIDAEGVIRHLHPNAIPLDETPIPGHQMGDPSPDRLMVLEIPGGEAARLGLRAGMAIAHPALPQDQARFPCKDDAPPLSIR